MTLLLPLRNVSKKINVYRSKRQKEDSLLPYFLMANKVRARRKKKLKLGIGAFLYTYRVLSGLWLYHED